MRTRPATALLVMAVLLSGCAQDDEPEAQPDATGDKIKIAIEGPISGDQKSNGIDMRDGLRLAIDEANEEGVLGKKLQLVEADDAADPEKGKDVAREMIEEDVFAVIGPYNSSVGVENLPLYLDAGVVPIHLTSNRATNGMGFTVQPKDYQTAPVEAKALAEFLGVKSVAIIYDTSTFNRGIAADLRRELEGRDIDVPVYEPVEEGQDDFEEIIEKVSDADADILYISTYHPEAAKILMQADEADALGECFVEGLAAQDPALVEEVGVELASSCTWSGVPSPDQFGTAEDYVSVYADTYDRPPGTWGTFTYDSLKLLIDAVERAGEWDAEKVTDELSKTKNFEGITGPITIDPETGNRVDPPVVILEIDGHGEFRVNDRWAKLSGFGKEASGG